MVFTSSEVDSSQLSDEQRETNANGRHESALVLLRRKHDDRENQFCGQEHLQKNTVAMSAVLDSSAVHSASYPCAIDAPPPRVVETLSGPGRIAETTAAADMAPRICDMKTKPARTQPTAPIKANANVTAGLNKPVYPLEPVPSLDMVVFQRTSTDSEEDPCIDRETEAEGKGDV